jgi:hypothetical protein
MFVAYDTCSPRPFARPWVALSEAADQIVRALRPEPTLGASVRRPAPAPDDQTNRR